MARGQAKQMYSSAFRFDGTRQVFGRGKQHITALHVPGDFVDLHSFVLHEMDHAVMTLTDCEVAYVPHPIIRSITEIHPHLARLFWLSTVVDGAIHREWLITAVKSSRHQFAHLICELYPRLQAVGLAKEGKFKVPLTQETPGVAGWLDDPSRTHVTSGDLTRMVEEGKIVGITKNPTIIAKSICAGSGYEDQIRDLALRGPSIGETLRLLKTSARHVTSVRQSTLL